MWETHFRMKRAIFFVLVQVLQPDLERSCSRMRKPISVEERVAMTLWWLSSPLLYHKVASRFEVGRSSVAEIAVEVCLVIEKRLLKKAIQLGNYHTIMDGFLNKGFPHCVGAIDGTHIPVSPPCGREEEYLDHKQGYSITVQGTVDHRGRFIDVELGHTGRAHDSHIFRHSALWHAMDEGYFVPGNPTINIADVRVPPLIIGDGAYPIQPWLMRPFPAPNCPEQVYFNKSLSRARNIVEKDFGHLKSRWGCLAGRLTVKEENFVTVTAACFVLHNICVTNGEVLHDDIEAPAPIVLPPMHANRKQYDINRKREGEQIRNAIAGWMFTNLRR
ncbi:protein ALP1-like [Sceloporus undulatus]|uniref:protein ALP1-like n=1 Tax=Sceloporus undulatus TaxID=8520 RepID=UPI001C4D9141|nr:protein ALP1-like [Sceloporus undulatus]